MVAFLLFLLPKPSDEAEQRQQMVPRAHSVGRSTSNSSSEHTGFIWYRGLVHAFAVRLNLRRKMAVILPLVVPRRHFSRSIGLT